MSAIAGWYDHQRNLSGEAAAVRAMTQAMAHGEPEPGDVRAAPAAVLGATARPSVLEAHGRTAAIVLDGEVYNAGEVRSALTAAGHRFRGGDVAEVVLAAYLFWGAAGCARRLVGAYAFAILDENDGELLLVRDRLGNRPLFFHPTEHGVVFASERKALLRHPAVEPVVDADGLRELLSYAGTPGEAVFSGMRQVKPGHTVRVGAQGWREEAYWTLEVSPHTDDLRTTVATVRSLIEQAVDLQFQPDTPAAMMLSGGLDSSGITALAVRALQRRGAGPLSTFTVGFREERGFQPDDVWATADAPFVRELVEAVGSRHTDIVLDTGELLDPAVRTSALRAKDLPSPLGNMNTSLFALFRAVRRHAPVAVLGDAADGIFGGGMWMSIEQLREASTFPWIAMAHWAGGRHGMGTDLLDQGLLEKLDLGAYGQERYRQALGRVPHGPDDDTQERRMRELWYINTTNWLETLLPHSEAIARSVGLTLRLPYCDHRLVEYVFNAPWAMKSFDGREKSLLRAALRDLLPDSIVQRRKTPYPVTKDSAYARGLCAELLELVADPNAPVAPLLDEAAVRAYAADPERLVSGPRTWVTRTHGEMLLQLNEWLGTYRIRLVV